MNYKLCRLCYEREAALSIFQSGTAEQAVIKIMYCCKSVKIQENDGLPGNICNVCDRNLDTCYQFLQQCEDSDKKLRLLNSKSACPSEEYIIKTEVKNEGEDLTNDYERLDSDEIQLSPLELKDLNDYETHDSDEIQLSPLELKDLNDYETHDSDEIQLSPLELKADSFQFNARKPRQKRKRKKYLKEDLTCSVCSRACASASALATHRRTHSGEKPFQCAACDKRYKDSGTLKRHTERNHLAHRERRFICENCGKGFYSKSDIMIHMRVHTHETPYACPICQSRFTQMSAMLRHKRRHAQDKTHACATCGKSFWTKEELKKHHSVHDDVRYFQCRLCNTQFKQKSNIKKHMAIHINPNQYICNYCGNTFNHKGNLKSHINRKHSEKSGYCTICCKNVSNLENHSWKHTGQRPLKCELCPSSFCETRALALHMNFKHKKTERFKCSMEGCTLGFPSKPMMMYHIARFHDRQTTYPCDRCPRGFYRKNDLSRHKIGTHKERLL